VVVTGVDGVAVVVGESVVAVALAFVLVEAGGVLPAVSSGVVV
jgi:hypothetical protein